MKQCIKFINKAFFALILSLPFLSSCIENDIPYPTLLGEITAFEVKGQISTVIDPAARTVKIQLVDTVNLEKVSVNVFEVSNNATVTPQINSKINLSSPISYTLRTYQDYVWVVSASQVIDRYVRVENQIGDAIIDAESRQILVTVSGSQDLSKIKIIEMKLGPTGEEIIPVPTSVKDFTSLQKFTSVFNEKAVVWSMRVIKSSVSVVTGEVNPYAKYALLYGSFQQGAGNPSFEYKKNGDSQWQMVSSSDVSVDGANFSAKITNLLPDTKYVFRTVLGTQIGAEKEFTTEKNLQLNNSGLDNWCTEGKSVFPNLDLTEANYFWDSGNIGANSLTSKNPTSKEENKVVNGAAAKMASTSILGVFAAGSIYYGKYVKTDGLGAELAFGRPFKSRPVSLKGHYNYRPGTIDIAKDPYTNLKGKADTCHIYVLLADWTAPFTINTTKKQFMNLDTEPGIIAIAQLKDGIGTSGNYKEFDLKLSYKSSTRIPNYILVVASASKYGDYFTGSTKSVLYLDELEIVY